MDHAFERNGVFGEDVDQRPFIHRQREMGVGRDTTMARKVLAGGGHAGVVHAAHIALGNIGHGLRERVKRPIADNLAHTAVEIEHRRETEIHPHGA